MRFSRLARSASSVAFANLARSRAVTLPTGFSVCLLVMFLVSLLRTSCPQNLCHCQTLVHPLQTKPIPTHLLHYGWRGTLPSMMSLHKLTAGAGSTYLTRQVAAMDATGKGPVGLDASSSPPGAGARSEGGGRCPGRGGGGRPPKGLFFRPVAGRRPGGSGRWLGGRLGL